MKNEIGSEFWRVPITQTNSSIFPKSAKWFISGRSALQAIIAENDFHSVALPDWCCDSMIIPFVKNGISVSFYNALHPPKLESIVTDAILVMNYFGFSSDYTFESFPGIVIRDLTHSMFSRKYDDADYYFGSIRKWCGFYTGGLAWGFKKNVKYGMDKTEYISCRKEAMEVKKEYISGKIDSKDYLCLFLEAEEMLENIGVFPASKRDIELADILDVNYIKEKRRNNAKILLEAFADVAVFPEIGPDDCPMFVPIRVKDRDCLRKWLIKNEIYCPVHWPISEYHQLSDSTRQLYDEEISLVCDQRYNANDMQRIVNTIRNYDRRLVQC